MRKTILILGGLAALGLAGCQTPDQMCSADATLAQVRESIRSGAAKRADQTAGEAYDVNKVSAAELASVLEISEPAVQGKGPDGAIACTAKLTVKAKDDRKAVLAANYDGWREKDPGLPEGLAAGQLTMPIQYSVAKGQGDKPDVRLHGASAPSKALLAATVRKAEWGADAGAESTCFESRVGGQKMTACGTIEMVPAK